MSQSPIRLEIPRRGVLRAFAGVFAAAPVFAMPVTTGWDAAARSVRAEMAWAWRNYVERAFGYDQIKPVSGGAEQFWRIRFTVAVVEFRCRSKTAHRLQGSVDLVEPCFAGFRGLGHRAKPAFAATKLA